MTRLEELNSVRKTMNMEPLDKLPEGQTEPETVVTDANPAQPTPTTTSTTNTDEQTKPVEAIKPEEKVKEEPKKQPEAKKPSIADFTTEDILKHLKEKGHNVVLDAKDETPEEKQAKRDAAKMAWAFTNNKISVKEVSSYNADSADLENLVYRQYLKEQKDADKSLRDADIWDEFQKKYDLEADPESRQYKTGQRLLGTMADMLLKEKYPNAFKIDPEYSEFEATENSRIEREQKITKGTPIYAANVEEILTKDAAKTEFKFGEDTFTVDIPQNILDEIKGTFLNPDMAIEYVSTDKTKDEIQAAIQMTMFYQYRQEIFENAVKQVLDKHAKGVKGIPNEVQNIRPILPKQTEQQIAGIRASFPNYQPQTN